MNRLLVAGAAIWLSALALSAQTPQARPNVPAPRPAPAAQTASARADAAEPANDTLKQFCVGCHSERGKAGGLSLADFDIARAHEQPETAEKIIRKLREADRLLGEGAEVADVARHLEVSEATCQRWRNQFGGMKADDAKRLKELERENVRLKRIVADKELEIDALREISRGNW